MRFLRTRGVALAAVCALASSAVADDRPAIVVTPGGERNFKVALQQFADASAEGSSARTGEFREDLGRALEFSGIFALIDVAAFLGPAVSPELTRTSDLVCADWTAIGADALVEGQIEASPTEFGVEFRVWDAARCKSLLRKRYKQEVRESPTVLAKRIADDIVGAFTGVLGVAATEMAFVSTRGGNPEIYVMDADGANARAATANRSINKFPAWAPDAQAIVYTSYRYQNRPLLYLSSRGRGKPGRLLSKLDSRLSLFRGTFDPSGRRLAVVMSDNGVSEIYTVLTDGRELRRLTKNGSIDISPSWSPSGDQIAFVSDRSGSPQVYVMDADGGNERRLTFDGNYNTAPSWSPDGRWIAYETRVGGQFDIWLVDPETGTSLPLVSHPRSDESPSWSPDSRKLVFSSPRRGRADLYVIDANGENLRRVTEGAGDNTSPDWGPYPR